MSIIASKSHKMDDEEGIGSAALTHDIPPPPYSVCLDEGENGHGFDHLKVAKDTEDASSTRSRKSETNSYSPSVRRDPIPPSNPFPQFWTLYRTFSMNRTLMLGEQGREPLHAVSRHSGWWTGKPDLILHLGPNEALPPLAVGMGGVGIGRHSIIVLPPLPGSGLDSSQELLICVEEDGWLRKPPHVRFQFAIEVGTGPGGLQRRETFEWRHTYGGIIPTLLEGAPTGWQLVRLDSDQESEDDDHYGPGLKQDDGLEIVAVWAYPRMSMGKILKFRFLESGATGVLGQRWAIMAVMTALRMYQRQQTSKHGDW